MLLTLILVVSKLKPQLTIALQSQQLLLTQPRLRQIVVVHKKVRIQIVNH